MIQTPPCDNKRSAFYPADLYGSRDERYAADGFIRRSTFFFVFLFNDWLVYLMVATVDKRPLTSCEMGRVAALTTSSVVCDLGGRKMMTSHCVTEFPWALAAA